MKTLVKLFRPCLLLVGFVSWQVSAQGQPRPEKIIETNRIFANQVFTHQDGLVVSNDSGEIIYQWQANEKLIPASLTKILTSNLAIEKWGLDYRFVSEFYILDDQLWVKGFGDPYLVSEEIEIIAKELNALLNGLDKQVKTIYIDSSYFAREPVPGRSKVYDPYNAPLSAVAANFNTAKLKRDNGVIVSAEPQTPITSTVQQLANQKGMVLSATPTRVNLLDANRAQKHFGELLMEMLKRAPGKKTGSQINEVITNQILPANAQLLLRHQNSKNLSDVLRGTLEYSNNFIANQLFLLLADEHNKEALSFAKAKAYVSNQLFSDFPQETANFDDGAGLARSNRVSANQLNKILRQFRPHKNLLKHYQLKPGKGSKSSSVKAFAKTGTLSDVRSFAGYLFIDDKEYQFVFMFNRKTKYQYRERLLQTLADQLAELE